MDSHSSSPSYTPIDKAKCVQLNGKTLQVLKKHLLAGLDIIEEKFVEAAEKYRQIFLRSTYSCIN